MKSSNKEGFSLGMGYNKSVSPISVPKMNSASSYGKKKPYVKPHGGDQYGVTMCTSEPAINFPTAK